jgi:Zn-dependent protease with chaperone function
MHASAPTLTAHYFDGKTSVAHTVQLHVADGALHLHSPDLQRSISLREVQWPERTSHGKRMASISMGGHVQCDDANAWDAWYKDSGLQESWIVAAQQNWRWVGASLLALVAMLGAFQQWGLPVAASAIVYATPQSVDESLGRSAMEGIDKWLTKPSELPPAQQALIRQAFTQALSAQTSADHPRWNLQFRSGKLGPNAFALPGGTIVMTDEMVNLADGDTPMLTAVLAHELGHVHHRHGLRMLVQASALAAVSGAVLGDFSALLAAVPALIGQAHYSREAEREADAYALQVLQDAHIPPTAMVGLFLKVSAYRDKKRAAESAKAGTSAEDEARLKRVNDATDWLGIAFASHPDDAERIAFFQNGGR